MEPNTQIELTKQSKLELKGLAYDQIASIEALEAQIRIHRGNLDAINKEILSRDGEKNNTVDVDLEVKPEVV